MRLIDVQKKLRILGQSFFNSSDVAALLGISRGHASKVVGRLAESGVVLRLTRGRWMLSDGSEPLLIPEFLAAPSPSYISLQTALFHHGMISQIPNVTYAVTVGKTRRHKTAAGTFSLHHLDPSFFFGFSVTGIQAIKMASPEKALLDFLYLSPARSGIFHALPEFEFPKKFGIRLVDEMITQIRSEPRRMLVKRKFQDLLKHSKKRKTEG